MPRTSNARRIAEQRFSHDQLNNNQHANYTLVFCPKSPIYPALMSLRDAFVAIITEPPLPAGFCPPIATGPKRQAASFRNVETLLANLLNMLSRGRPSLSVSLDWHTYSATKLTRNFPNLVKLAAHMSRDLLTLKKGFLDHVNAADSRQARVKPTRKFTNLIQTMIVSEDDIVSQPHDLINLRVGKTAVPRKQWERDVTPEQADILRAVESSLRWFNFILAEYDITYKKTGDGKRHPLFPVLYAVYTDDFDHGGRLYTGKGGHLNLSKQERRTIRLNGHKTVELDYGGLHIRMLYHLAGADYPLNSDPYAAVIEALGKDARGVFAEHPDIRDDLKVMLLALVNGKGSEKQAIARAERRLFESWHDASADREEEEKLESEARRKRWRAAGLKVAKVVRAFSKAHEPIKDKFSTGRGLRLQNIDATIARWIMFEMMLPKDCCIPCLPVHDSFITFAEYKTKLRDVMTETYTLVMRNETECLKAFQIPVK